MKKTATRAWEAEKASERLECARLGNEATLICGRAGEASHTESAVNMWLWVGQPIFGLVWSGLVWAKVYKRTVAGQKEKGDLREERKHSDRPKKQKLGSGQRIIMRESKHSVRKGRRNPLDLSRPHRNRMPGPLRIVRNGPHFACG